MPLSMGAASGVASNHRDAPTHRIPPTILKIRDGLVNHPAVAPPNALMIGLTAVGLTPTLTPPFADTHCALQASIMLWLPL